MILRITVTGLLVVLFAASVDAATFKGKSAPVQIDVPAGWTRSDPAKAGSPLIQLLVTDTTDDAAVMVLDEPAASVDLSLDEYAKAVVTQMTKRLTDSTHTKWQTTKVDGHPALQCEVRGVRSNVKLAYLVTVLKSEDSFDQVLAFTGQSKFDDEKLELKAITISFKVAPQPVVPKNLPDRLVKGKNGKIEMHLPASYRDSDGGSKNAQIFAADRHTGCFVEVLSENRKDSTLTLDEYGDNAIKGMLSHGADGSATDFESLKINGSDALQSDVSLTFEHVKVTYVVTLIQTPEHFQQVLAWSLSSSFEKNRPELVKLAQGLKEIPQD